VLWQQTAPQEQGLTVALDQPGINGPNVEMNYSISALGGLYTFDQATGSSSATPRSLHITPYNAIAYGPNNVTAVDVAEVNEGGELSTVEYAGKTGFIDFGTLGSNIPPATHPMIDGDFVYVGSGSSVLAFPLDSCPTGPVSNFCFPAWNVSLPATASMPVGISNKQIAVAMSNGNIAVLDATTGALQFTATTGSTNAQPPTVDGAGSFITGAADGRVRAFSAAGCGNAMCPAAWVTTTGGAAIVTQPVFASGLVYVGTAKGHLQAFAAHSCESPFCVSLADLTVDASATSIYVIENNAAVYVTTNTGKVVAYQAS
jgi:outer membrane protein assembly factor BamB